jgi:hypothetical protein
MVKNPLYYRFSMKVQREKPIKLIKWEATIQRINFYIKEIFVKGKVTHSYLEMMIWWI